MNIFEFEDYKKYLLAQVGDKGSRSGMKTMLSKAMGCHGGYLSQVLHGGANVSLEQAQKIGQALNHNEDELHFFLLLVQLERAGTLELANYFKDQIHEIKNKRMVLNERLQIKNKISDEDKTIYYSSWIYSAIHMALGIPHLSSIESISEQLGLTTQKVSNAINLLIKMGLVESSEDFYQVTNNNIFLEKKSPHILKHHTNWKLKAIESLEDEGLSEMHYSGVVSLSHEDATRIKDILIKSLKGSLDIVTDSKEEDLRCLSIDFFSLLK